MCTRHLGVSGCTWLVQVVALALTPSGGSFGAVICTGSDSMVSNSSGSSWAMAQRLLLGQSRSWNL